MQESVEKRELFYIVEENMNFYNHYGEEYGVCLKKNEK